MRVRNFFLIALAASMALVSCDKSENDVVPTDTSLKSVTLTLPNITKAVGSRATGTAMQKGQIALKSFKVFFLAGNQCVNDRLPSADKLPAGVTNPGIYFDETTVADHVGTGKETTYHFLPAEIDKVVVVGNVDDDFEYADINKTDYSVLNDGDTDVDADDNNHPYYPLYGESSLTPKNGTSATDNQDHNNVYVATVNLAPRVARFEIYGFEYKLADNAPGGTPFTFESVELEKIALANYATTYTLATGAAGTKVTAPTDGNTTWDWIDATSAPWANAFTDYSLEQNDKTYVNTTTAIPDTDEDGSAYNGNMITYGVTESTAATDNPELLLSFYGVNGTSKTPLYLHGKFTNAPRFEAGKIYRVLFPIEDGAWTQPERCVELTVTVASWSIVSVTPDF